MTENGAEKNLSVEYYDAQGGDSLEQEYPLKVSVAKILFDFSHSELLSVPKTEKEHGAVKHRKSNKKSKGDADRDNQEPQANQETEAAANPKTKEAGTESRQQKHLCNTWLSLLKQQKWDVAYFTESKLLTEEDLAEYNVLVLAAPTKSLHEDEVNAITNFVNQGNALLVAHNYQSLFQQEQASYQHESSGTSINTLLARFGLRFKRLLSYPPDSVSDFNPHYLSAGINRLFVREPAYLELLKDLPKTVQLPQVVAHLPWTNQPFLVAIEAAEGRVVAIADFLLFTDTEKYIEYGDNQQLLLNVFHWLTLENRLDCFNAYIDTEVQKGQATNFSILLHNPQPKRLEHIRCLLESDSGAVIVEPQKDVRSIASFSGVQLHWTVEPRQLGSQKLKLTIDLLQAPGNFSLFFDTAAQFDCSSDVEIDLVILNQHGKISDVVETGDSFEVQAVVKRTTRILEPSHQLELEAGSSNITIDRTNKQSGVDRWRFSALSEGESPITLVVDKKQRISRLIRVLPSVQDQIAALERNILNPLAVQIHYQTSLIRTEFDTKSIKQIPCHLYPPEAQVRLLNSPKASEFLLEILQSARIEERTNIPLVKYLLSNITPTYSPVSGAYLPYAPELVAHLKDKHKQYEELLSQNFLSSEGYGEIWLEQNIAALILHEKYGHGFFFKQTTLGQQLEILYRHGMTPRANLKELRSPYPRSIYQEYSTALQALWDSTIIVNEGFATWIELTVISRLSESIGQAAYRRKDFLFNRNDDLAAASKTSFYFKFFPPFRSSRYQEGYEYFQQIQSYFGEDCGSKCVVQSLIKAADVDVGVSESNGQVQFALEADALTSALIDVEEDDARTDMRLRLILEVLQESSEKIRLEQKRLQCYRECLHSECPVNAAIREKLGW